MTKILKTALVVAYLLGCLGIHAQGNSPRGSFFPSNNSSFPKEYENPGQNEEENAGSEDSTKIEPRTGIGFGVFGVIGGIIPPGAGFHFSGFYENTINLSLGYSFSFIFGHGFYAMSQVRFLHFLSAMTIVNRVMNWTGGSENLLTFGVGVWGVSSFMNNYKYGQSDEFVYMTYTPINWDVSNTYSLVERIGRFSIVFGFSP